MHTQNKNRQKLLLRDCLKRIELKLGWPDPVDWGHSHFELLSEKIFEDTKVRLSVVTLKRIWGKVSYHSFPSISTLDTLAKFIGYESWMAYQQDNITLFQKSKLGTGFTFFKPIKLNLKKFAYLSGVMVVIIFIGLIIAFTKRLDQVNYESASFDFEPVTLGIPNTVTFTYNVNGSNADSVFIQQSWDPNLRHKVDKDRTYFASTYYYPGFYKAKLIINDKVVSEKELYIKSDGWLGTIEKSPVPFYLDYQEIFMPGMIEIDREPLNSRGFDLNEQIPYTNLHLVDDFDDIPADNFKLVTEFRNTLGSGQAICQKTRIFILCSEAPFIIPFSIKGCIGELKMKIPGKLIEGQNHDLQNFGVDFSQWVKLDLTVSGRLLDIHINGRNAFKYTLPALPGKVVGVQYQFHGTGAVKSLEIQSDSQIKYKTAF